MLQDTQQKLDLAALIAWKHVVAKTVGSVFDIRFLTLEWS
jgi:hypothetical protein